MILRTFPWIRTVALVLAGCAVFPPAFAADARPPNVVFILTDDQRYDELGHTGHPVMLTPNIDALARDGVRFAKYFSTTAVCLPSRTTLVTGQWERAHTVGFRGARAPEDYREMLNLGLNGEPPAFEELFDLQSDPTEQRNLAVEPAHAASLAGMRARCVELLREALGRSPEAPLPSATVKDWKKDMKAYYAEITEAR